MSTKPPAFQFYAADYLADENVALMTLEEEGAYIRALAYCWREGSLPADETKLSRLLKGCSMETLTTVRNCFNVGSDDPSRLVHPRLEMEREKQEDWRRKSAEAGKLSGKSRREKKLHTEPTLNQRSNLVEPRGDSSSSSSSSNKTSTPNASPLAFICPQWLPSETWKDFEDHRNKLRKPMTDRARRDIVAKLDRFRLQGQNPDAVISQAIRRGWLDVFELREDFFVAPKANPLAAVRFANGGPQ